MVIRFLHSWQTYRRGGEYEISDGVATTLIRRGMAQEAGPVPVMAVPPIPAKRKPGRPRKS